MIPICLAWQLLPASDTAPEKREQREIGRSDLTSSASEGDTDLWSSPDPCCATLGVRLIVQPAPPKRPECKRRTNPAANLSQEIVKRGSAPKSQGITHFLADGVVLDAQIRHPILCRLFGC